MKKGLIAIIALALALPLTASAQGGPRDGSGPLCTDGPRMAGQCPVGPIGGGPGGPGGPGGRMGHRGMGGNLLFLADELELTEQQRDQMKQMMTDHQMERIDLEANLDKAEVQLRSLMIDEAPQADIDRAIDRVSGYRADTQKMQYRHRLAMKNVLTTDQQAKLKELRKERFDDADFQGRGMRGKQRGGGRGQGNP